MDAEEHAAYSVVVSASNRINVVDANKTDTIAIITMNFLYFDEEQFGFNSMPSVRYIFWIRWNNFIERAMIITINTDEQASLKWLMEIIERIL